MAAKEIAVKKQAAGKSLTEFEKKIVKRLLKSGRSDDLLLISYMTGKKCQDSLVLNHEPAGLALKATGQA